MGFAVDVPAGVVLDALRAVDFGGVDAGEGGPVRGFCGRCCCCEGYVHALTLCCCCRRCRDICLAGDEERVACACVCGEYGFFAAQCSQIARPKGLDCDEVASAGVCGQLVGEGCVFARYSCSLARTYGASLGCAVVKVVDPVFTREGVVLAACGGVVTTYSREVRGFGGAVEVRGI